MHIVPAPHSQPVETPEQRLRRFLLHLEQARLTHELDAAAFPRDLAEFLIYKSVSVYRELERQLSAACYSSCQPFEEDQSKAVAFVYEGHGILVFRGTQSWTDILRDLKFRKCGVPPRHRGFEEAWGLIRLKVLDWAKALPGGTPLVLTGHSLGGAMAILAALELRASHAIRAVVTFGAPRVGGVEFRDQYDALLKKVTWRVEYGHDPVARVPPPEWDYRHVGKRVWINGNLDLEETLHDALIDAERDALELERRRREGPFVPADANALDWLTSDEFPLAHLWGSHPLLAAARPTLQAGNFAWKLAQRELAEHGSNNSYSRSFWINSRRRIELEWPDGAHADQICAARLRKLDAPEGLWYVRITSLGGDCWRLVEASGLRSRCEEERERGIEPP